jgi:putative DNA primase/helicase
MLNKPQYLCINHREAVGDLLAEMATYGIIYGGEIIVDGQLHRFHVEGDKPGSLNGWYIMFDDLVLLGKFGCWKRGVYKTWHSKSSIRKTESELRTHKREITLHNINYKCALETKNRDAAILAKCIWDKATSVNPNHAYLTKKRVHAFGARQSGIEIILAILNFTGEMKSLQFIHPTGMKRLLPGGRKKECYILVNDNINASELLICEGFATGATLAQKNPDKKVIAAIDVGNLKSTALNAALFWPHLDRTLCLDDDRNTPGNPGITLGLEAANASHSSIMIPHWPDNAPGSLTDFNDLECWLSKHEVSKK